MFLFLFFSSFYQTNIFLVIDEVKSKKDSFTAELLRLVAMGVDNTSDDPDVKNIHFYYIYYSRFECL